LKWRLQDARLAPLRSSRRWPGDGVDAARRLSTAEEDAMARRMSSGARRPVPTDRVPPRRRRWLEAAIVIAWGIVAVALAAGDGAFIVGR
jgi:hypothetical protein